MTEAELSRPDWDVLDKLGLVSKGQLNRGGVLLFSHYPEKWVARCYTRIGFFPGEANVAFQDEVHGSLLEQAERVMELLYSKYLSLPLRITESRASSATLFLGKQCENCCVTR